MPDSPVINDSDDFVPMPPPGRVEEGEAERRLDPIPFEFTDIRALAQRILKRAQEQGMQKIEAARKQAAAIEKQAHDKGYAEGLPKGEEKGFAKGEKEGMAAAEAKIAAAAESEKETLRQSAAPVTGVLEQLASILHENRQQLIAQAEADLLLLALDIAKRLIGHELKTDPEAIRPIVTEAIGLVTDRSAVTVRVNPEDKRVMQDILPELKTIFPDLGPVQIEEDPSIERGGLAAATRESEVDMRLATRLAAFEEAILGFSGEAAAAPWNAIPAEAIEEEKRRNAVSPYSLPPAGPEEEKPAQPEPEQPDSGAADAGAGSGDAADAQSLPVTDTAEAVPQPEEEAEDAGPPPPETEAAAEGENLPA